VARSLAARPGCHRATLQAILDRHTEQRVLVLAPGEIIQAAHTLLLDLTPAPVGMPGSSPTTRA
jgi:hypothetical protein